jgi:Zn-dependent protease
LRQNRPVLLHLDEPQVFVALGIALFVAVMVHGLVQAYVASALGDRQPLAFGRGRPDPRRHFEPFGVVAMLIAGIGWGKAVPLTEPRFRGARGRYVLAVLSGPAANLLVGLVFVAFWRALDPVRVSGTDLVVRTFPSTLITFMAVINVYVGVLTLVPLPPLDGSRLLWLWAPRTPGWQKARYYLEEQNVGLLLCVALILPLFRDAGLLARLVFSVSDAVLDAMKTLVGL